MKRSHDKIHSPEEEKKLQKRGRVTRNNPMSCEICKKQIAVQANDSASCKHCELNYHITCIGMKAPHEMEWFIRKCTNWKCPRCIYGAFDVVNEISGQLNLIAESTKKSSEQFTEQLNLVSSTVEDSMKKIHVRINEIETKTSVALGGLQSQIDSLRDNPQCSCNDAIDQLKQEIEELKRERNSAPTEILKQQEDNINYLRSLQRKNNLVIQGVPQVPNENEQTLREIVTKIGSACGTLVTPASIVQVYRMKNKTPLNVNAQSNANAKPSPILVRFNDASHMKDTLFLKYLEMMTRSLPLKCNMIGFNFNTRIYINQHLSNQLLQVKDKAILLKKIGIVQKVTPRYNHVHVQIRDKRYKLLNYNQLDETIINEYKSNIENLVSHYNQQQPITNNTNNTNTTPMQTV